MLLLKVKLPWLVLRTCVVHRVIPLQHCYTFPSSCHASFQSCCNSVWLHLGPQRCSVLLVLLHRYGTSVGHGHPPLDGYVWAPCCPPSLAAGLCNCDQESCVHGLGLFGHCHSWSCVLIDLLIGHSVRPHDQSLLGTRVQQPIALSRRIGCNLLTCCVAVGSI